MPNVVLEAMLYGMPVLSRCAGAIADVVEHGVNGFLTESTDPDIFAGWIVELATSPALRYRMSIINHEKARQRYATTEVRTRFLRVLDEVLDQNPISTIQKF